MKKASLVAQVAVLILWLGSQALAAHSAQSTLKTQTVASALPSAPSAPSAAVLVTEVDHIASGFNSDLKKRWELYLGQKGVDAQIEKLTIHRLKEAYANALQAWADRSEACDPKGYSFKWLPRFRARFGREDTDAHRAEIAQMLGMIYAHRVQECSAKEEEIALRRERELQIFSLDHTKSLLEFLDQLKPGSIRVSSRRKILELYRNQLQRNSLADRTVSVSALRLETQVSQLPSKYLDFLNQDPAFKRPFDLGKNLAAIQNLPTPIKPIQKADEILENSKSDRRADLDPEFRQTPRDPHQLMTPLYENRLAP